MEEVKPCFYLWIQSKLQTLEEGDGSIDKKKARTFLRVYRIPKVLWEKVIKEMINYQMIEQVNRFKIKIINLNSNPFKTEGIEYVRFNSWDAKNKN
jgi:hypothetical protein